MTSPQETASLLTLATELLLLIADGLDSKDLRNLAATCSRLYEVIEPFLWQSLEVLTGAYARRVLRALQRRPQRAGYIQNLKICYATSNENGIEVLDPVLQTFKDLRHFTLETPCPLSDGREGHEDWNPSKINYEKLFLDSINPDLSPRPFTMLQSGE